MTTLIKMAGVTFTSTPPDPRVITGSLILVDNSHPLATKNTGAAGSATYTNLAAYPASIALGSALATIPTFNTATSTAHASIGYTAAGSPHLTSSITADVATEQVGLTAPSNLLSYLQTYNAHSYYLGLQFRVTRAELPSGASQWVYAGITTQLGWAGPPIGLGRTASAAAGYPGSSDPRRVSLSSETVGSEIAQGISATDLSPLATTAPISQMAVTGPNTNSAWLHTTPSWIFRSLWLLDLTVAGMTHAQAWALDQAAHTAAISSRWASDSVPTPLS